MKICVIGNSHLGMIAAAYREGAPPGCEFVFWGRPGLLPSDARFDGTHMIAEDDELKSRLASMGTPEVLDILNFDAVVFVAMSASAFSVAALVGSHRVFGWPGYEERAAPFISEAALQAGLIAKTEEGSAYQIAHHIRQVSDCPIVIVPQPFPSARLLEIDGKYQVFKRVHHDQAGVVFGESLQASLRYAFAATPGVTVLAHPSRPTIHGFLTKKKFTRGAVRFNPEAKQPFRDILHANAGYGHIMLRRILKALRG